MAEHELLYRTGTFGLSALGYASMDPRWFCVCRGWSFEARSMPRRRTGTNKAEAISAWHAHVRSVRKGYSD